MDDGVLPQEPLPAREITSAKGLFSRFRAWTGFGPYIDSDGKRQRGKTLWDWLGLLIVPILLVIGGTVITQISQQGTAAAAKDSAEEALLESYLDRMDDLILNSPFPSTMDTKSKPLAIATTLTRTVLLRLDTDRKTTVLQFLNNAQILRIIRLNQLDLSAVDLGALPLPASDFGSPPLATEGAAAALPTASEEITPSPVSTANVLPTFHFIPFIPYRTLSPSFYPILRIWRLSQLAPTNLIGSELSFANLAGANLSFASLNGADLSNAVLTNANLSNADLTGARLGGTNLTGADLHLAILTGSTVTNDQLATAKSLTGAKMLDGTIHP